MIPVISSAKIQFYFTFSRVSSLEFGFYIRPRFFTRRTTHNVWVWPRWGVYGRIIWDGVETDRKQGGPGRGGEKFSYGAPSLHPSFLSRILFLAFAGTGLGIHAFV